MLIADDKLLVETAERYKEQFKVPVCGISSMNKSGQKLSELYHDTSENKIREIVNLAQKLNSVKRFCFDAKARNVFVLPNTDFSNRLVRGQPLIPRTQIIKKEGRL